MHTALRFRFRFDQWEERVWRSSIVIVRMRVRTMARMHACLSCRTSVWMRVCVFVSLKFLLLFASSLALNRLLAQSPAEPNNATGFFYSIIICSVINKLTPKERRINRFGVVVISSCTTHEWGKKRRGKNITWWKKEISCFSLYFPHRSHYRVLKRRFQHLVHSQHSTALFGRLFVSHLITIWILYKFHFEYMMISIENHAMMLEFCWIYQFLNQSIPHKMVSRLIFWITPIIKSAQWIL